MNLKTIHHIAIIVSNYEKSKDFYVNKLGLWRMNKTTEHGEYYFSFFSTELKTEKSLDELFPDGKMDLLSNSEISEDEKKSYVHEFVHFIQDITTIYGLKKLNQFTFFLF